ncbi:Pentatricopeptide repeat-containing protein At5g08510 [Linum grandiflorum]
MEHGACSSVLYQSYVGMKLVKQIHAHTIKNGTELEALIVKLIQFPNLRYAHKVFDDIPSPHIFLYNKLIQAYASNNQPHQSLRLFSQMLCTTSRPNEHTFTFVFQACASFPSPVPAQSLHTCFAKSGFASDFIACTALVDAYAKLKLMRTARQLFDEMPVRDVPTWNSLIAGYGKCGDMEAALEMFNLMPRKSVVSWTAMISGYSQNGLYANALEFFLKMEDQGSTVRPNEVTIASVLPACANLGALDVGERIDAYARGNGLLKNLYVSNALLEMYSRCGQIHVARRVFDEMGNRRNLCSWNSMIMGLAVHGRSSDALSLYDEMLKEGTAPDDVTFVGLLLACTHGGMVSKGKKLLESMETDFGISPKLEHYGCMVDLLGRAGDLQQAYDVIKSMPMRPDSVIWGTLLGACSFHNDVELAEVSAEALFELEPWNPGNYVILSNVYASKGRWDGVARLRKMMKGGQITKAAGYSFVEVAGRVHKFMVGDGLHPRSDQVYRLLEVIYSKMGRQKHGDDGCDLVCELEELCLME